MFLLVDFYNDATAPAPPSGGCNLNKFLYCRKGAGAV